MNDFHDPHSPTPEFRAALKRELRRSYRADLQFDALRSRPTVRLGLILGVAAGALVTLTIGLAVGASARYASAEGLSERQRSEAVAISNATRRQFATMRLELARANYDVVRREVAAGTVARRELQTAKAEVDSMQAELARVELEAAENRATSPEPRTGLAILRIPMRNALTALTCAATTAASQPSPAQQGVPVVSLTPVSAKTTTTLGAILGVRELPSGRVLVNDAGRRQIKIFDPSLASATVAQDSMAGTSNSYGSGPARIVPYLGDSTLFVENVSRDVSVLDRDGHVVRAVALPMHENGTTPFPVPFPTPKAIDDRGRLLGEGGFAVRSGGMIADSTLIFRADLDSRQIDIVGTRHTGSGTRNRSDPPENGYRVVTSIVQPVPTEDSWSVLSDGTIAFVRGRDYHVDWILPDGTKNSTDKLPFDWKRLTDEDKQHLIDSARVVKDSLFAIRNRRVNGPATNARGDIGGGDPSQGRGRSGGGAPDPVTGQGGSIQRVAFVPLSEIPDYYPPIHPNATMADVDGNLWILPTTSAQSKQGELVYDVVNPKRGLFQRVRMPVGRSIAGFGKGGVVYLQSGDRTNGFYLERARVDVAKPTSR